MNIDDFLMSLLAARGPNPLCEVCQKVEARRYDEDPYRSELHDDHAALWMCCNCYRESLLAI